MRSRLLPRKGNVLNRAPLHLCGSAPKWSCLVLNADYKLKGFCASQNECVLVLGSHHAARPPEAASPPPLTPRRGGSSSLSLLLHHRRVGCPPRQGGSPEECQQAGKLPWVTIPQLCLAARGKATWQTPSSPVRLPLCPAPGSHHRSTWLQSNTLPRASQENTQQSTGAFHDKRAGQSPSHTRRPTLHGCFQMTKELVQMPKFSEARFPQTDKLYKTGKNTCVKLLLCPKHWALHICQCTCC